jgi:hypothetical protein
LRSDEADEIGGCGLSSPATERLGIGAPTVGGVGHPDNPHTYGGMMIAYSTMISETS